MAGYTAQHFAVASARPVEWLKLLLDAGADVNAASRHGVTPLMLAAAAGANGVANMRVLIERGADVRASDARGW